MRKQEGLLAFASMFFKLGSAALTQMEMLKLMSLQFDNGLEFNLDNLDKILATFWKEPDDDLLLALAEPQLRRAKHLSHQFVFYDRVSPDSLEKSFSCLFAAARRAVQRKRAELVRDAMTILAQTAPTKGNAERKGSCDVPPTMMAKAPCFLKAATASILTPGGHQRRTPSCAEIDS